MSQRHRIKRRSHFDVIVEVNEDVALAGPFDGPRSDQAGIVRSAASRPGANLPLPTLKGGIAVTAHIEFFVAMQADVNKVARRILHEWPLACGVRDDESDVVLDQEFDELFDHERFV